MNQLANITGTAHKAKEILKKTPKSVDLNKNNLTSPQSGPANLNLPKNLNKSKLSKQQKQDLFNKFWICCRESRIESPNSFYGCFYIGPFNESLSQTLANTLRRVLLSELSGLAITAVEIEGVLHKFSNLPGIQETVVDILCNLQNIVFRKNFGFFDNKVLNTQIAYLRLRGPGVIKASDIILPAGLQCVNPDQQIATLAEDGALNMKIYINEGQNYIKQKQKNRFVFTYGKNKKKKVDNISDFVVASNTIQNNSEVALQANADQQNEWAENKITPQNDMEPVSNKIYLDSVFMPVTKVNTIVQNSHKYTDFALEKSLLFQIRQNDNLPDQNSPKVNFTTATNNHTQSAWSTKLSGSSKNKPFFTTRLASDVSESSVDPLLQKEQHDQKEKQQFVVLSEINKTRQNKQCHIIVEIWTNGSIHPREALYNCLRFLSKTFGILENVKSLGSMFKSDLIYRQILNKNTN